MTSFMHEVQGIISAKERFSIISELGGDIYVELTGRGKD